MHRYDPRWDDAGFSSWANSRGAPVKFVKVAFLRSAAGRNALVDSDGLLPKRVELPDDAVYTGSPPSHVGILAVVSKLRRGEPSRALLHQLVDELEDADGDDCVFWSVLSIQSHDAKHVAEGQLRMHTYYRVRVIALVGGRVLQHGGRDFFKQGQVMVALVLSSYCQRIINAKAPSDI